MEMVQAYRGYFERERFIPLEANMPMAIPEHVEVFITITGRALSGNTEQGVLLNTAGETKTLAQKQLEAFKQFRAGIKEITDEPIDDEFRAIVNSGITIDSGVEL
jgi:hypothetical protein